VNTGYENAERGRVPLHLEHTFDHILGIPSTNLRHKEHTAATPQAQHGWSSKLSRNMCLSSSWGKVLIGEMYANVRETSSSSSCLDLWRARIAQRYSLIICASLSSVEVMVSDRDCIFFLLDSIRAWASAREPVVGGSGRCILTLLDIGWARDVGG